MAAALDFSIILPAYNEALRLPPYLASIRERLRTHAGLRYEILVVDDGSQDNLADIVRGWTRSWPELILLQHSTNQGKGAAVRRGILAARGDLILFADADGATPIAAEALLRQAITGGADVAIGSRLLVSPSASLHRCWWRHCSGQLFAILVRHCLHLPLRDTQCGFKMFRREVAWRLFQACTETGYLFDLEILLRAHYLGYRIAEIPVSWRDVPGSKVNLLSDGWKMIRGLGRLRRSLGDAPARLRPRSPKPLHPDPRHAPSVALGSLIGSALSHGHPS